MTSLARFAISMYVLKFRLNNRPQYEAPGNNYRVCRVSLRAVVYCVTLNFNISGLAYSETK